jgi:hypothetical protein
LAGSNEGNPVAGTPRGGAEQGQQRERQLKENESARVLLSEANAAVIKSPNIRADLSREGGPAAIAEELDSIGFELRN